MKVRLSEAIIRDRLIKPKLLLIVIDSNLSSPDEHINKIKSLPKSKGRQIDVEDSSENWVWWIVGL